MKQNNNILKVGTDFSGIGAPEQALTNLGIEYKSVFACEIDKFARKSYEAIHQKPETFYNDITQRNHAEVEQLDLYVAGFPCQAFSIAGNRKGFDDVRGTLFFDVADFIRINQPKCFILENVKGLLSHNNGATFQTIVSLLSDNGGTANGQVSIPYFEDGLGYHIYYSVLNSKDYGVPQNRERIFIVGFRDFRSYNFPKCEHLKYKLQDVLQDDVDDKFFLSQKYLKNVETDSMIKKSVNNEISTCIDASYYKGFGVRNGVCRQVVNDLAGCLLTTYGRESLKSLIKRQKKNIIVSNKNIRKLTPLECWRLQSFPDHQFKKAQAVNSDTQLYKQAGNSITVRVIQKIISKIYD